MLEKPNLNYIKDISEGDKNLSLPIAKRRKEKLIRHLNLK